jgi:bifunctional UDP-N-acetylglucosamine pyrophosphorylase / glucosamine-1-phosphate N-acetyltransferase
MSASAHIRAMEAHARRRFVEFAVLNTAPLAAPAVRRYARSEAQPVANDGEAIRRMGIQVVGLPLASAGEKVRHEPERVGLVALQLAKRGRRRRTQTARAGAGLRAEGGFGARRRAATIEGMSIPVSAIILAAGLGTRMRSKMAKVLHCAGGGHLLEHVIAAGRAVAPAERITAVIGHQAERVRAAVEQHGVKFATQKEQLGTGDAVNACRDLPQHAEGRIIVLYGDCPLLRGETIEGLLAHHIEQGCAATLITTHLDDPTGYGRIYRDDEGRVVKVVEEKACLPEEKLLKEINSGIYCFEAAALWPALAELRPNPASGEYYLTDIPEILARNGLRTAAYVVDDPHEILGINTRLELADVDRILRARRTRALMIAGVTIEQPETVRIDAGVEVGMDTVIGPFAQLRGRTRVGEGCAIGACSIVEDSSSWRTGRWWRRSPMVAASRVGEGAHVGPFARLRMGALVEEGAHVGNFVELKKTKLGVAVEGDAPGVSGRRDDRGWCEHWGGDDHVQLRREEEARDGDWGWGVRGFEFDAGGPGRDRREELRGRGERDHEAGADGRAGHWARASGGEGGLGEAAARGGVTARAGGGGQKTMTG